MFVGYSLKAEAEQAIQKFPKSMREKLKFLLTHSSSIEQHVAPGQHYYQHSHVAMAHQHLSQQHFNSNFFATGGSTNSFGSMSHQANSHILKQLAVAGILNNVGILIYFNKIILNYYISFFSLNSRNMLDLLLEYHLLCQT